MWTLRLLCPQWDIYVHVRVCVYILAVQYSSLLLMWLMPRICHSPQSLDGWYPLVVGSSVKLWTTSGNPWAHGLALWWGPPTRAPWPVALVDVMISDL